MQDQTNQPSPSLRALADRILNILPDDWHGEIKDDHVLIDEFDQPTFKVTPTSIECLIDDRATAREIEAFANKDLAEEWFNNFHSFLFTLTIQLRNYSGKNPRYIHKAD